MPTKKNLKIIIYTLSFILVILIFLNIKNITNKEYRTAQIAGRELKINNILKISSSNVQDFKLYDYIKKVIFYQKIDYSIYEADLDQKTTKIIGKMPDVKRIIFSPFLKRAIVFLEKGNNININYFDFQSGEKIELDKNIKEATFSPNGKKIVYHLYDSTSKEGKILVSNLDSSKPKLILKTRVPELKLYWPKNDLIAFLAKNKPNDLFIINIQKNELNSLEKITFQNPINKIVWSKDGNKFLVSVKDESSGIKNVILADLYEQTRNVKLKTKTDQCVWSVDNINIYCGQNGEIFKLNTKTGKKIELAPNLNVNPTNLQIDYSNSQLVFINQRDHNLYTFKISE